MSYFSIAIERVPLPSDPRNKDFKQEINGTETPPGHWADVKTRLSYGDAEYRSEQTVKVEGKGISLAQAVSTYELQRFTLATLERAIVRWNLTETVTKDGLEQEVDVPVSLEAIRRLWEEDCAALMDVVNRGPDRAEGKEPEPSEASPGSAAPVPPRKSKSSTSSAAS